MQEEQILTVLKEIIDPDLNRDIVSLGFVKNIHIQNNTLKFDLCLTTPACPVKEEFVSKAKDLLNNSFKFDDITINLTAVNSPNRSVRGSNDHHPLQGVRTIIAVSSCKGGVGKSSVAAHIATELAGRGFRVGLLDIDIHGPSLPALFQINRIQVETNDQKHVIPVERHGVKLMSFGFLLGDAPAVMRGPIISQYVQTLLFQTDWGTLDYLFLDLPPGTGDVQLTLTQTVPVDGAVIVTTPQNLSLIDVSRGIIMFEKVKVPVIGIIENMAYFECPDNGKRYDVFGPSACEQFKRRFGVETLGQLPLNPEFQRIDPSVRHPAIVDLVDQTVRAIGKGVVAKHRTPQMHTDATHLHMNWSQDEQISVPFRRLRSSCPCAVCVDEITGQRRLDPDSVPDDIKPLKIIPLGNYAVGIEWSDGHASGIYSYEMIQSLTDQK
jgi:ATP-binding protein involved in chromosome partitioning